MSYIALTPVVFTPLAIYFFVLGAAVSWVELSCANELGGLLVRISSWSGSAPQVESARQMECLEAAAPKSTLTIDERVTDHYAGWFRLYLSYVSTILGLGILVPTFILFFGLLIGWRIWRNSL